jgi:ElaB/YqjD/DUF883 family membrane-anchored ribosome-binding protein
VLKRELEALHSEAQKLQNERVERNMTSIDEGSSETETAESHGAQWNDVLRQIEEIADEIAKAPREHPILSVASAFAIGVLLGRLLPR